ncbi:MAG: hypothetical protein R2940_12390 [Syntrophotaleaceae bacterium]
MIKDKKQSEWLWLEGFILWRAACRITDMKRDHFVAASHDLSKKSSSKNREQGPLFLTRRRKK